MSREYVFWLHRPSLHVYPLVSQVAATGARVRVVVNSQPTLERVGLGAAPRPLPDSVGVVVARTASEVQSLAKYTAPDAFHYFSGIATYPLVGCALRQVAKLHPASTRAVFSEPFREGGLSGLARRMRLISRTTRFKRDVSCVLAAGVDAVRQFRSALPNTPVHEFGYFVDDANSAEPCAVSREPSDVRMLFVGQLIERKGLVPLIDALGESISDRVTLTVVGDGPLRPQLGTLAAARGVRAEFRKAMGNAQARQLMTEVDRLVLPSRFDGWGAVVNEALSVGTPVLVSNRVGARSLIRTTESGLIFHGGVGGLRRCIGRAVAEGPVSDTQRSRLRSWYASAASATAGAEYLIKVAASPHEVRPPPWHQEII